MLPRADAPATRLPYTTADMAERLAKKKAEQDAAAQAQANQALRFGVTNPPVQEDKGGGGGWWPSWKELGNAGKMGLGTVAGAVNTVVATPLDIADEAVQGLEKVMGVKPTDKFDPASIGSYNAFGETYRGIDRAANYVAGQIAATPGVGKPSSSPFMDTVRSQGWANAIAEPFVHAVNVGSVAYPVSKMAVGAKLPGTIADAYRQRLLEREIAAQNNLFPAVQRPANVINVDALQGSRLPARVEEQILRDYLTNRNVAPIPTEIPNDLQEALSTWLQRQGISDVTPDVLAQGFKNKQGILSMPVNPNAPSPSISLKASSLADVLDSGGYGSMFDGGVSTRTEGYDLWRQGNEAMLYGLTEGDPRPIYGFLRAPGDPYTAAGYGKTVQSTGLEGVTADDNFIINIKPNAPMTSAPADSFRVDNPADVLPLTSTDKPAVNGYREVQIWADKIPTSDIQSAELVFAEPRGLFRTILRDSDTTTADTLNAYIGKIDALLGTKIPDVYGKTSQIVLDKLDKNNIPTTITVRRDFGLTPRVANAQNVRQILIDLRREAATYLQRIATEGEATVKQQINAEVATLFTDPQQNYMADLIRRGQHQQAGSVFNQMSLKGNANPFYPGDNVYNQTEALIQAFKSPNDIKQFIEGTNVSTILKTPKISEIIFAITKNKLDEAAQLISKNYSSVELFNKFAESNTGNFSLMNFEELADSRMFTNIDNETKVKIIENIFNQLPADRRILLDKQWSEYESFS